MPLHPRHAPQIETVAGRLSPLPHLQQARDGVRRTPKLRRRPALAREWAAAGRRRAHAGRGRAGAGWRSGRVGGDGLDAAAAEEGEEGAGAGGWGLGEQFALLRTAAAAA